MKEKDHLDNGSPTKKNKANHHKSRAPSLQQQTDQPTNQPTDQPTYRAAYRVTYTWLKTKECLEKRMSGSKITHIYHQKSLI